MTSENKTNYALIFTICFIFQLTQKRLKMTIRQRDKSDMNIYTAISLGIAIAGFIGGIITAVAKLAVKTGQIMEKLQTNEKRDDEERAKSSAKFSELYNRMAASESNAKETQAKVDNLMGTCNRIESKLDRLIEREAK